MIASETASRHQPINWRDSIWVQTSVTQWAFPDAFNAALSSPMKENPNLDYITNSIFIGNINILKNNIPNKYIRNYVTYPPARFFWSSIFGDLD